MFKHVLHCSLVLYITFLGISNVIAATPPSQAVYDTNMLPTTYNVYTNGTVVINRSAPGFSKVLLPTYNNFTDSPGCYIACYSRSSAGLPSTGYSIGSGIWVHGQVRVSGSYNVDSSNPRNCVPTGYNGQDISKVGPFNNYCNQYVPFCSTSATCSSGACWAGEDTGGWYGIQ